MKKAICIALCCVFAASLVAVPVFATSVPETTAAPNVIDVLLDGDPQMVGYTAVRSDGSALPSADWTYVRSMLTALGATSPDTAVGQFNCHWLNEGSSVGSLWVNGSNLSRGGGYKDADIIYDFSVSSPSSTAGVDSAERISGVTVTGIYVGGSGLVQSFSDEVFSVGGTLISFVMSNWIVLIPVVAFLVILCIGVIRKTVKGA